MKERVIGRLFKMLIAGALCAVFYYIGKIVSEAYYYTTMFLSPLCALYIFFQFKEILIEIRVFRQAVKWAGKRLFPLTKRIRKLWSHLAETLFSWVKESGVYRKMEYLHLKDLSRITGYSDEYIPINKEEQTPVYDSVRLKWKKCRTNSERVRYLYAKYVLRQRRDKHSFRDSDTPMQLQLKWGKDDYNDRLFPDYYRARYTTKEEISDEEIRELQRLWKLFDSKK